MRTGTRFADRLTWMRLFAATLLILTCACARSPEHVVKREERTPAPNEIRTVDSSDSRPAPMQAPPVLADESPAPKPMNLAPNQEAPQLTPQDERVRAQLPFAPAMTLDPVDGLKVSIRATTPMVEYKNHVFYFTSDANKRTFLASPDQYLKGVFGKL